MLVMYFYIVDVDSVFFYRIFLVGLCFLDLGFKGLVFFLNIFYCICCILFLLLIFLIIKFILICNSFLDEGFG